MSGTDTTRLLPTSDTVEGAVDYKNRPALRVSHGGWRSALFIVGVEVAERIAYYGIASNLISYLTGPLGQSTAAAAANVNTWAGVTSLLPLAGALVADSFLGRYRTIVVASLIYILGLAFLSLSALLPSLDSLNCGTTMERKLCHSSHVQVILFFFALYLVAIGQSGHKPCVQAFGADQFDGQDPEELKAKSSFFNWWYFSMCLGAATAVSALNYIQDYLNWALGFGVPCIIMFIALVIFLLGTRTYRYMIKSEERSPFVRIGGVFATAARNWRTSASAIVAEQDANGILPRRGLRFLDKALVAPDGSKKDGRICSMEDVEEAKSVVRLFPIWATCLVYAIVFAQSSTFFTKQGVTMDRSIGSSFSIPAASLQSFISIFIVIFIPIYDRLLVPFSRSITGKPAGISILQRIGIGLFISTLAMVIAAVVESKRLEVALEHGLIDLPHVTVPMSVWWLIPQYALFGISDVFTMVGLQEFFYDQVPSELRSIGASLYLSIFGVGSLLSSFLVSSLDKATNVDGQDSWFANNLNRAHLDYFYWLLAALSALGFALFAYFSGFYVYTRKNAI
ncbi:NRT1/ PTR FAMILY 5.10-like protein [Drosera capensis]